MKKKAILLGITTAAMLLFSCAAFAETYTTDDGVISIEAPSASWAKVTDPNYWFAMTDGKNTITIDHLSNGESLPVVTVADDNFQAVYQAYFSTRNEVFVVKGEAVQENDLISLIQAIGSIKVLKFDTKTAIPKGNSASVSEFGLTPINAIYRVTADELMVRSECSTDSSILGTCYLDEEIMVKGAVTRNGADYGWYQVVYNGSDAYVNAQFVTPVSGSGSGTGNTSGTEKSSDKAADDDIRTLTVYAEDGSYVPIYFDEATGTWTDGKGLAYLPMAGALMYEPVNGTYWNGDPSFWNSHSSSEFNYDSFRETMTTDMITVYAEDGSYVSIYYDAANNTWTDGNGLEYLPMAGSLVYDPVNDIYWNGDPSFWDSHSSSEFNYDSFQETMVDATTVYAEDGSVVNIYYDDASNTWTDGNGLVYLPMAGALLYEPVNGVYWDIDPSFWSSHSSSEFNYDSFQESIVESSTEWMTLYSEGGNMVAVYYDSNTGVWMDDYGYVYTWTQGGIPGQTYTRSDGTNWSADPSYWAS